MSKQYTIPALINMNALEKVFQSNKGLTTVLKSVLYEQVPTDPPSPLLYIMTLLYKKCDY